MPADIAVVGAGVSGLAAAHRLRASLGDGGHRITVYEAGDSPGGSVRSERVGGFLVEWGPNGFLNNEPATIEVVDELGIRHRIARSRDAARRRFIKIGSRLREVPVSPPGFVTSDLLPLTAKLRFAVEPFLRGRRDGEDESVAGFIRRRFGATALERLFDPLVSGVYAGDAERLSIGSTLDTFAELEREHGSVVRGMIRRARQRRRAEAAGEAPADELLTTSKNPMVGTLLSFEDGMGELTGGLASVLGDSLQLGRRVLEVRGAERGYELTVERGGERERRAHDIVVVAVPPAAAAPLVVGIDDALGSLVSTVPSASIAVVALGFPADELERELDGFGYLIPRREGVRPLGVLWSSSIFENRAPEGRRLLTVMIGGAHDPDAVRLPDDELIELAVREVDSTVGVTGPPVLERVMRHRLGIPQYPVGHPERLQRIEQRVAELPGLYLTGNGYAGISTNDCLRTARELADRVAEQVAAG